jgi:alkanesulfonate monooxygenase SsuD/methylene tetrahydromethanopterin reductase-like flavin-dependent oxidoreductase (luciferase family)
VQEPLPIWVGVGGTVSSAERAGRLGLPMTLGYIGGTLQHLRPLVDAYRAAGARAGHPERLQLGLSTHLYVGANPAAARVVYPYFHEYLRPKTPGGRGFTVTPAAFEAATSPHGATMVGSAEELTTKLLDAKRTLGLDRVYGQIDWGGLPQRMVEESIARFAQNVAPTLREG